MLTCSIGGRCRTVLLGSQRLDCGVILGKKRERPEKGSRSGCRRRGCRSRRLRSRHLSMLRITARSRSGLMLLQHRLLTEAQRVERGEQQLLLMMPQQLLLLVLLLKNVRQTAESGVQHVLGGC